MAGSFEEFKGSKLIFRGCFGELSVRIEGSGRLVVGIVAS